MQNAGWRVPGRGSGTATGGELDDAGLKLAAAGRYVPAVRGGNPVRAGFFQRLDFFNPL